jgi:mono/diheme cytochrome c family protein
MIHAGPKRRCRAAVTAALAVVAALASLPAPVVAQAPSAAQSGMAAQSPVAHAAGRMVYAKWCAPCHDPGVAHPGTNALTVKYKGVKSGVLLEWRDLPPATVKALVRHGISVMPQFRKTEISDAELDALAAYLARNTPAP